MDLDLTPRKYKKAAGRPKRRRTPRILKNLHNPFQLAIIGVAVVAFAGTFIVERISDRNGYTAQSAAADEAAGRLIALNREATAAYDELQTLTAGVILKQKTDQEMAAEQRLVQLTQQLDEAFQRFNACYEAMPSRYQSREDVRRKFVDLTLQCLDAALARKDYEQARLWFNASGVNIFLEDARPRIAGIGRLEISVDDQIESVVLIPILSDGPKLVLCDPLFKGTEFPFVVPELEKGSYLIWATRTNGTFASFPVYIEHGQAKKVRLELPVDTPEGMVYIPAGEFHCGGDESPIYRFHKVTLPAYFIRQNEVTIGEYLDFWHSIGDPEKRDAYMSRIRFDADHGPTPAWDEEGHLLDERLSPELPVVGISHEAAEAYCSWLGSSLDRVVRLPDAFEWEKAARGVDDRTYPWGYGYDPNGNFALALDNTRGKARYPLWAPPGSFLLDASIYDVFDMAGNVREMTSSHMPGRETYQIKGGSAFTPSAYLACSYVSDSERVPSDIGFRYVMEIPEKE